MGQKLLADADSGRKIVSAVPVQITLTPMMSKCLHTYARRSREPSVSELIEEAMWAVLYNRGGITIEQYKARPIRRAVGRPKQAKA